MDFSGVLQTVLAITTIIGVALAGLQRGVVQNLREANKDLRDRDADRDKKETELEAKVSSLSADLTALGRVVTNEVQIASLTEAIHAQGDEFRQHRARLEFRWEAATDLGQQILEELRNLGGSGG